MNKPEKRGHHGAGGQQRNLLWERPGFLIRRLRQIHVAIFLESCRGFGVTPLQYSIMSVLNDTPNLDQSSLAEAVGVDRVNAADVITRMERAGLIARRRDERDRRIKLVSLTKKGASTLKAIEPHARYAHDALLEALSPRERNMVIKFLQRMVVDKNGLGRAPLKITWE